MQVKRLHELAYSQYVLVLKVACSKQNYVIEKFYAKPKVLVSWFRGMGDLFEYWSVLTYVSTSLRKPLKGAFPMINVNKSKDTSVMHIHSNVPVLLTFLNFGWF